MPIYFGRLRLRNLTNPPPPFHSRKRDSTTNDGVFKRLMRYYFGWIPHILRVDDKTLIQTAGLDAFAFLRVCQFGLQLFVPLATFSMLILMPIHVNGVDMMRQHAQYVIANVNTTAEAPGGLILTTVANIQGKQGVLWLHTVGMWLMVLYTTWLLKQHSSTFVVLRTLYLTTRGDTNLWRVVHQPSNFIEQLLVQGTHAGAEIDDDELRKMKSANSDDINAACDALAAMDEYEDEQRGLLKRAVDATSHTAKSLLTRAATVVDKRLEDKERRRSVHELDTEPSPTQAHAKISPFLSTPHLSPYGGPTARRLTPPQVGKVAQGLKGAGTLFKSPASAEADGRQMSRRPSVPETPTLGGASTSQASSQPDNKTEPGPVTESRHFTSFTSGENSDDFDLTINPPVSEPPTVAKRRERKLRMGSFGSLGAMPASVSQTLREHEAAQTSGMHRVTSREDIGTKQLMEGVINQRGNAENLAWLASPTKSPRRGKHNRMPTMEDLPVENIALTPAVKKALARVKSLEDAGEAVRYGGFGSEGVQIRAETSIAHDWWVGLDVTHEFKGTGSKSSPRNDGPPLEVPERQTMEGEEPKRNLTSLFDDPESPLSAASPVTRASLCAGDYLQEAPSAMPDVNSIRTVNAFDTNTNQIVSVWASSYTVLITDIPFVRAMGEDGEEVRVRGLREVEATLEYIYGDEFRGLIPIFDHRPADALLDSRDECKNMITRIRMKMAREGIIPETQSSKAQTYKFGTRLCEVEKGTLQLGHNWKEFKKAFADLLRPPKHLRKLPLSEQLASLEAQLEAIDDAIICVRKTTWEGSPGPCAFAVFENQVSASTAAQCVISRATHRIYRALPAPGPDDVNWPTLLQNTTDNRARALAIWPFIIALMIFPTGMFATAVTSVCQVREGDDVVDGGAVLDWYCSDDAKVYTAIISGVLPPIILTLWEVFVISFYMMYLVQRQNVHVSLAATDRRFLRFYWAWGALNVLLGGIFGGALSLFMTTLSSRNVSVNEVQLQFGRVLPLSSNFFLLFIVFRAIYLPVQRLLLPHPGSFCLAADIFWCEKRGSCARTSRDKTRLYSPRAVRMGREIGVFMLIMVIGLTFVCIAPLIPLAAALFYVTNFVIWRYHVLYVYERGYESNGSVWFTFTQLVILSLIVAQTFLSCVLFSKQAYIQGAVLYATVPYYLSKVYRKFRAEFGSASASGWFPDIGKVWRGYPGVTSKNN
jgi:DNA-directed RNA polymerase III subunit RPC2